MKVCTLSPFQKINLNIAIIGRYNALCDNIGNFLRNFKKKKFQLWR